MRGFTLIEVLVGMIIVALTFGGLVATFTAVNNYISRSGKKLTASNFARSVLGELNNSVKADEWNDSSKPLYPNDEMNPEYILAFPASFSEYSGSYTVTNGPDIDGDTQPDYRIVTVTVNYPD